MTTRSRLIDLDLTWDQYVFLTRKLAGVLRKCHSTPIEQVMGIARGGVVLAICLSHLLNIPYLNYYDDETDLSTTLLVDDLIDTGEQMQEYSHYPGTIAVLIDKWEGSFHYMPKSINFHYYCAMRVPPGMWVRFPWELE